MTPKDKALDLFNKYNDYPLTHEWKKQCALIAVENEYNSLRKQLIYLRACRIIEDGDFYLERLQFLIDEEIEVKKEIEKL